MTTEELIIKVQKWAHDRNIINGCPPIKQAYKTLEECGELIEGIAKHETKTGYVFSSDKDYIKDAIGDITVTLIIQCAMQGIDFVECLAGAYEEIKDRKGKLVNGQFIKEHNPIIDGYYYLVDGDEVLEGDEVDINEDGKWVPSLEFGYIHSNEAYVKTRRKL